MNLHFRESGPADGSARGTILFLHGFPFDGSMWAPQLAALPEGWHGIAPDLRGFGETPMNALRGEVRTGKRTGSGIALGSEPVLTMSRLADDVAELIDARAGGRAVICGLSMGGYVAFELWRRHRGCIQALVLADTRAEADDDEARENRRRMAQTARSSGVGAIASAMLPSLLSSRTLADAPALVEHVTGMILSTAPETVVAALAGMAARHDMTDVLPRLDIPTLVVAGEEDAITPTAGARRMAVAVPDASFHAIPRAGHLSNMEQPTAFNEALAAFIGGIPEAPRR